MRDNNDALHHHGEDNQPQTLPADVGRFRLDLRVAIRRAMDPEKQRAEALWQPLG